MPPRSPPDEPFSIRSTTPDQERTPDIRQVDSLTLIELPRSRREIVHFAIHSRNTGEFKGHRIGFRTRHKVQGTWQPESAKSFTLETEEEIRAAVRFILAACEGSIPNIGGSFVVLPTPSDANTPGLQRAINALSQEGKANLLVEMLNQAAQTPELLENLMEQAARNPELFAEAAATLNLARYRQAHAGLNQLIETSNREQDFQRLLAEHPWMFGSEYSELLSNRNLVRGSQQDFVLRRTSDGYIELVEIKTPMEGRALFRFDDSHQSHYAGAALSMVIGQVQKYLEEVDAGRYEIRFRDNEDPNKVRAKIIIGRDGDEAQRQALRRFNGHLHRIEVLTFDHLSRTAGQVVSYLERLVPHTRGGPVG
ncbi:MAG TPA: Shedu anti-phage system protein SduA domain-containing protein [Microvirga sp.]|jgi:hypothetical protein|nr:Shedu anti-phage system protein SduA domain-containing protein [Microvirga sp.]